MVRLEKPLIQERLHTPSLAARSLVVCAFGCVVFTVYLISACFAWLAWHVLNSTIYGTLRVEEATAGDLIPPAPHGVEALPFPRCTRRGHSSKGCVDACGHLSKNGTIYLANLHGDLFPFPEHSTVPSPCEDIAKADAVKMGSEAATACSARCESVLG
eukprot:767487-Amphidinium_carterae.1